jgi:hypothetical protein
MPIQYDAFIKQTVAGVVNKQMPHWYGRLNLHKKWGREEGVVEFGPSLYKNWLEVPGKYIETADGVNTRNIWLKICFKSGRRLKKITFYHS